MTNSTAVRDQLTDLLRLDQSDSYLGEPGSAEPAGGRPSMPTVVAPPAAASTAQLIDRYDGFLLDAYGVLVHGGGAFAGAAAFLRTLDRRGKRWCIVSNDASKTPEFAAARYQHMGLPVPVENLVNAAMLLPGCFARRDLVGAPMRVLGPHGAVAMVERAGGVPLALDNPAFAALVVADESGYPLLPVLDDTLTAVVDLCESGQPPALILPNPDLTYSRGPDSLGFAAGSLAAMLQAALNQRLGADAPQFEPLGKPQRALFDLGLQRLGLERAQVVMVGDQLATDVRGGRAAGLDTALVTYGVGRWDAALAGGDVPTWLLAGL